MLKTVITISIFLLCSMAHAQTQGKIRHKRLIKEDGKDIPRVAFIYGQGEITHSGDFDGNTGKNTTYSLSLEYLKTNFSSTYLTTYSHGDSNELYQLEKGYFYYPFGAKKTVSRTLDLRAGANFGFGKFHLKNVPVDKLIYHEVQTWFYSVSPQIDGFWLITPRNHLGIGAKYNLFKGSQDVFWDAQSLELNISILHRF